MCRSQFRIFFPVYHTIFLKFDYCILIAERCRIFFFEKCIIEKWTFVQNFSKHTVYFILNHSTSILLNICYYVIYLASLGFSNCSSKWCFSLVQGISPTLYVLDVYMIHTALLIRVWSDYFYIIYPGFYFWHFHFRMRSDHCSQLVYRTEIHRIFKDLRQVDSHKIFLETLHKKIVL